MMLKPVHVLGLLLTFGCAVSCTSGSDGAASSDPQEQALVSVNGRTLSRAELSEIIPAELEAADSAKATEEYIRLWVNNELMYEKAQQNVADKDRIKELVENYRRSLMVYTYQEQLLKETFWKDVKEADLKAFYEENKDKFRLESNIMKGLFLKIPVSSPLLNNFREWYKAGTPASLEKIEKNYLQNAVTYTYFYDVWKNFDDIMSKIPYTLIKSEDFLRTNRNLEVNDSSFVYLLNIKQYALTGTAAPYEYVKPQIQEMLLNQQKERFMKKVEDDLLKKAIQNNKINYFYK
ncbi:hypothetical protein M2132_001672 [Dysgonomonas sp. PH5-45]|uniref:peptidylprolyl isomerase n=1 Tax=unclassified Dysgonomonas TaxID=2630389 RepID=UPI002473247A|nr:MULTISPECIES: peptidylprolyl isomerase [unclassified Dysgonomonas]MDH6355331.1 hypothetical protein [Dysgonomonas sp. PH5-45]MDH6388229.1 hypothetical protein [Dysgonomonas sp. PH5-37]